MDRQKRPLSSRFFLGTNFGKNDNGTSDVLRRFLEVNYFILNHLGIIL